MHLDPVTSEAYRPPGGPETFEQQRLRLDRQKTLSFGPQRARHREQAAEMAFETQNLDHADQPFLRAGSSTRSPTHCRAEAQVG